MSYSPLIILAIDPGSSEKHQGAASILRLGAADRVLQLMKTIPFWFNTDWDYKLFSACFAWAPDVIWFERVHSRPGQGVKSMFTFGEANASAKTAIRCAGFADKIVFVDPQRWQRTIGMPHNREIVDPRKRRAQRIKDDKARALKEFPQLEGVEGDVYASVLIGLAAATAQHQKLTVLP